MESGRGASLAADLSRIFFWINSGCNARCRMCDIWKEAPGKTLTASDVARWTPGWRERGVSRVVLCGEPLLHPELVEVCAAVREEGIRLDMLTNGLLLERMADQVVASCDTLTVSLDGPEPVHNEIRGRGNAYARLRAGVRAIREKAPDLPVAARCAVHRMNAPHLRATVTAARDLGVDGISFSGVDLHNEAAFRREGVIDGDYVDGLSVRGGDLDALETELSALITDHTGDFATGFLNDSPGHLRSVLVDYYRALDGRGQMPEPRCNAPWRSAVVEYDGTVRPCFPMEPYGNIFDTDDLFRVVDGEKARAHRADLDVRTDATCLGCVCQTRITDEVSKRWAERPDELAIKAIR
ncbi:radical SAM protein [Streptomyces sp. QL37]|uniref:radical SAM protein n=1 Tax=Streptomyces sp. QL37 TaxID=2093747 RepID=UPI000CF267FA|nr:radical SAM protein [Streptomyces sp. QL37]PPQ61163.1 radical SAM protein [Streptomyces sp. QL37]